MIGYVMLGTSDLNHAVAYYDATLPPPEQFHIIGQQGGGSDEGAPGPREEGSDICCTYLRDPDGNKLCAGPGR